MRTLFILLMIFSTLSASAISGYTKREVKRLDRLIRNLPEFRALQSKANDTSLVRSFFVNGPDADSAEYYLYIAIQRERSRRSISTSSLWGDCLPGYFGKIAQPVVEHKVYDLYVLKYNRKPKTIVSVMKRDWTN